MDLFLQDGTRELIVDTYHFETSGIDLKIQQMEYENAQLEVGVPQVVWRASLSLSRWLDESGVLSKYSSGNELTGIELGSGTGLLGVFTAKRLLQGGVKVKFTLTDMEDSVSF